MPPVSQPAIDSVLHTPRTASSRRVSAEEFMIVESPINVASAAAGDVATSFDRMALTRTPEPALDMNDFRGKLLYFRSQPDMQQSNGTCPIEVRRDHVRLAISSRH